MELAMQNIIVTQNSIIGNLKNVYDRIDFEFWIVVADRPVDINIYLSQLQLLYNQVQNPAKRKLIKIGRAHV